MTHLQCVAGQLQRSGAALVAVNPRLYVPSPLEFGRRMTPLLMRDFRLAYAAESEALDDGDDAGVAIYLRWPHPRWRLYERRRGAYAFVGTTKQRPSDTQLRAVYTEVTGTRDAYEPPRSSNYY